MTAQVPSLSERRRIAARKGTYSPNGDGSMFCRLCWHSFDPSPILGDPKGIAQHVAENARLHDPEKRRFA